MTLQSRVLCLCYNYYSVAVLEEIDTYLDRLITEVLEHGSDRWYPIGRTIGSTDAEIRAITHDKPNYTDKLLAIIEGKRRGGLDNEKLRERLLKACDKISILGAVMDGLHLTIQ